MSDDARAGAYPGIPRAVSVPLHPRGLSVVRCPVGTSLTVAPLNFELLCVEVHWEFGVVRKGRDRPCTDPLTCPFCLAGQSVRWQGWTASLVLPGRVLRLVPITRHCWDYSPGLRDIHQRLRGQGLRLTRNGERANAAITAQVVSLPPDVQLPPCPDMEGALGALWGMTLAQVDAWRAARRAAREISSPVADQHLEGDPF